MRNLTKSLMTTFAAGVLVTGLATTAQADPRHVHCAYGGPVGDGPSLEVGGFDCRPRVPYAGEGTITINSTGRVFVCGKLTVKLAEGSSLIYAARGHGCLERH
ncbi:hypothetical protein [Saccharothrix obliqua]|uniref:hypothetical protein n=1 Tax=Saccharothrix obliqua TaxID=2861747 RepID=UPI001C5CFBB3|nr:hypothetical protein [Saccharothrix obliqua]MBW4721507.1 hypothetical protein [Saccharothrix obliqua]